MNIEIAKKNKELVGKYRQAMGWSKGGGVGPTQQGMMDDLMDFCGLNQACFKGSESDMIKNLGRIEVLGRMRFFLNFSDDDMMKINTAIEESKR